MAQEERIYDDHLLVKLSRACADAILDIGKWPETFQTYESVLKIARQLSHPGRFLDSMAGSLLWTVEDLRRDRPAITEAEMAYLLGISRCHVHRLVAQNAALSIGERLEGWLAYLQGGGILR